MEMVVLKIREFIHIDSRVEEEIVNQEPSRNEKNPKHDEAHDDSSNESFGFSTSDCSDIKFSENEQRFFFAAVVNDSDHSSKHNAEENQRSNHDGSGSVDARWFLIEFLRQIFFVISGRSV